MANGFQRKLWVYLLFFESQVNINKTVIKGETTLAFFKKYSIKEVINHTTGHLPQIGLA